MLHEQSCFFLLIGKKCAASAKLLLLFLFFLLIRSTVAVFYRSRYFHPVFGITRLYIFFEETINIKESFAFSPGQIYMLGNLRTTTKFTTTTSVDWEKTGTRTSVSAGKRKVKMRSVGRSTTATLNVNTDVKL